MLFAKAAEPSAPVLLLKSKNKKMSEYSFGPKEKEEAEALLAEELGPDFVRNLRELQEFESAWGALDDEEE